MRARTKAMPTKNRPVAGEKEPAAAKRLNINLPKSLHDELQAISEESQRSMTDVVRDALSLLSIVHAEEKKGRPE